MDQRLFCPHCSAAYETTPNLCQNCGGAIPEGKWPKVEDLPVRLSGSEASEESALEKRDADEDDDNLTIVS